MNVLDTFIGAAFALIVFTVVYWLIRVTFPD
jgi:hypothetical protein